MTEHTHYTTAQPEKSSGFLLVIAWLVVAIPAAWGVSQTVYKSMALFNSPPPANATGK